ncbi:MAG: cbb3-type cytochrome oxidase assembly protein CcoS [Thermaurantimonas sp.]
MEIIYVLIFISIIIASGFLVAFVWNVNSGQYDDDVTPAIRMLFDNEAPSKKNSESKQKSTNK